MSAVRNLEAWAALLIAALAAGMLMTAVLAGPAQAAPTLFVTTTADEQNTNGQCSLREAIVNANANDQSGSADCGAGGTTEDEIRFDLGSSATITLASQLPAITDSAGLTIAGGGANITVSGNSAVRVFQVDSGAKLTLDDLTAANGKAPDGNASVGGGIHNAGTLTVRDSTISSNSAGIAGGIQNNTSATLTVSNSTISSNEANWGGGIYNQGTMTVTNSTIADNTAYIGTSGIINYGPATLKNTIVANTILDDSFSPGECGGTGGVPITDGGYNLDSDGTCGFATENNSLPGVDPMLGPLADNGGPTKTHALLEGSPAIDKGNSFGATADQRSVSRPLGPASDIGSFEFMDTTAPKVNRVVPAENATGIAPGANVSAFFSEAMRAGSINPNTVKLFKAGTQIDAAVSYDAATRKAVLNPDANLQRGARYKAVVTAGARDLQSNRLDQNAALSGLQQKAWFFTVRN